MKPGDIIGFSGDGPLSAFINLVTYGVPFHSLSHIGILAEFEGNLLLFESTTLTDLPCEIKKREVKGAQAHKLLDRLYAYPGKAWHYPLYRPLYDHESKRLTAFLKDGLGTPYDQIGAFRSGGLGFSFVESLLREQDLAALFCSEWVMAAYEQTGIYPGTQASKYSPNHAARTLRANGILFEPGRIK